MDREHRHQLKHDKFVDEVGAWSQRAHQNQRVLLAIGGAAVAIALLVYGVIFFRSNREDKAQAALAGAIETAEAATGTAPAPETGAAPKFKTDAERDAASEKQFKEIREKFSSSDASDVAGLYLARSAAARGDAAGARKLLEEFVKGQEGNILAQSARFSLFQLRIEGGEATPVLAELTEELKKTDPALPSDSLLLLMAQAYQKQGNVQKSEDTYRRIVNDFPESPYAAEARKYAGEA